MQVSRESEGVQMSELKAYRPRELVMQGRHNEPIYLKSEADKVIARHKYKRCLAMARIAQDDWHLHNSFYAMGHQEFEKRKCEFYEKWRQRWLAIADKFKPNSTAH